MPEFTGLKGLTRNCRVMLMVDLWGGYLQLANTVLHVLQLSSDRAPVCNCHCKESGQASFKACSGLVKEVLTSCLDQVTTPTTTTTTTHPGRLGFSFWLWLLILVFICGILVGFFLVSLLRLKGKKEPATALVVAPLSLCPAKGVEELRHSDGCSYGQELRHRRAADVGGVPRDPNNLDYHCRILWYRVDRSVWIISTPDYDVYEEDYDGMTVIPLNRNSPYPAQYAGMMYVPDSGALMQQYLDMKRQADSLAVVRGCADRPGVPVPAGDGGGGQWRVADVDSKRFGEIIPHGELSDPQTNVMLDCGAVRKRLHVKGNEILTLEMVEDFDRWKEAKRPGLPGGDAGDLRILGCSRLLSGKRQLGLSKALEAMHPEAFPDWPHRGPKATKDFLESVLENGGDLSTYHAAFMRKSGLSDHSAAAHELKNLLQILKIAISCDQLDVSNVAAMEQVVRRVLEIQIAVRRNPKHPTFDSFDYNTRGSVDEIGGARAAGYFEWTAEQQKAEAKTLKSTREWRQEQEADRRRNKNDKDSSGEDGDGAKTKKKKKKKKGGAPTGAEAT